VVFHIDQSHRKVDLNVEFASYDSTTILIGLPAPFDSRRPP
jgi:hypothetical protein